MATFFGVGDDDGKGAPHAPKQNQAIGEYCNGKDVAECRGTFGNGLESVCATCPE